MNRHTPGPWEVVTPTANASTKARDVRTVRTSARKWSRRVARVYAFGTADADANARLIAAAPELLRVLTAAEHALRSYELSNANPDLAVRVADAAKAVLDQAEGRS